MKSPSVLPRDTPRSRRLNPDPPCPLIVGVPASGTPGRTPILDTLLEICQSWDFSFLGSTRCCQKKCCTALHIENWESELWIEKQLSDGCPTIVQQLSYDCQMTVRWLSDDFPTTVLQLSDDCRTTVRRLSNNCPTTVWLLSDDCPPYTHLVYNVTQSE